LLRAAISALRFDSKRGGLEGLCEAEWRVLLPMADQARLALPLGIRCRASLSPEIRDRIDRNLEDNALRHRRAVVACREVKDALGARGIPFVFLKGLTHFPRFAERAEQRQQYDIDVYGGAENAGAIGEAAAALGYEAIDRGRTSRTDHLPIMIRRTGWRWRGDYYDPEMPLHLEIHFRLWDEETEMLAAPGAEEFWNRREIREASGLAMPAFCLRDTFRYACRHAARHLLRGDLTAGHLYEIAHFLETTAVDDAFWVDWCSEPMLAEALAMRLARDCFGCRMHSQADALVAGLPPAVQIWFDLFALSPLMALARPNKDSLLLHLLLVRGERWKIAARRLWPPLPARYIRDPHAGAARAGWMDQAPFRARRALYHARALLPVARSAARWLLSPRPLEGASNRAASEPQISAVKRS
jgi:hypothetical protein